MHKLKLSWSKFTLITVLSLGFMVLGIGSMSWAMFRMWGQSDYFADAAYSPEPIPATVGAELNNLTGESTAPVELVHPYEKLHTNISYPPVKAEDNNVGTDPSIVPVVPDKPAYPENPAEGDLIGSLTIPALNRKLPIFKGTGEKELEKGVGHFIQSVRPGVEDNSVLSGHRETVFRRLYKLEIGDQLIVETSDGTFTYEVTGTRIVHKDDKTVIVPTDHAVLTLTTCYPFYFLGRAPDRYIVSAALVKTDKSFD